MPKKSSKLFLSLELETSSLCNRKCPTCIRNSHPDRETVKSWFEPHLMPLEIIKEALDQCVELGFSGSVCLSHYNEPLLDNRIVDIIELVKSYNRFFVCLVTNGDLLTKKLAKKLDDSLDKITISLYEEGREEWVQSLFTKVEVDIKGKHIRTHFRQGGRRTVGCKLHRLIINHRRQYLLCCEDVVGNFDLGKFPEINLYNFWFGEKRERIIRRREAEAYCSICPRWKVTIL